MLELAVAASCCDETPSVVVQHPQDFTDLHRCSISGPGRPVISALCGITLTLSGRGEQREARSVAACGSPPRRAATGPALYYDLQAIVDHSMI
jgi:hypothetical protein